jgi:hypothetical protein
MFTDVTHGTTAIRILEVGSTFVEQLLRIQELANQRQVPLPPILENAIRGLSVGVPAQTSGRSMGN